MAVARVASCSRTGPVITRPTLFPPLTNININGAEILGHCGGVTVYHRSDDCQQQIAGVATLQD